MWLKTKSKALSDLNNEVEDLQHKVEKLRAENQIAKDELADVKHQKKIEEEDIKHMVKLKEERMNLDFEKRVVTVEREQAKAIARVKDEFQDKQTKYLEDQITRTERVQKEILGRLPNVNVRLNGDV